MGTAAERGEESRPDRIPTLGLPRSGSRVCSQPAGVSPGRAPLAIPRGWL